MSSVANLIPVDPKVGVLQTCTVRRQTTVEEISTVVGRRTRGIHEDKM